MANKVFLGVTYMSFMIRLDLRAGYRFTIVCEIEEKYENSSFFSSLP